MSRILVVDDSEDIRKLIRAVLKDAGHEILEASNGNEAVLIFKKQPVDLVILDIVMPEKDGIETIIDLKKNYGRVKIIAISGGGRIDSKSYLDIAKKMRVEETLTKPFTIQELKKAVEKTLSL